MGVSKTHRWRNKPRLWRSVTAMLCHSKLETDNIDVPQDLDGFFAAVGTFEEDDDLNGVCSVFEPLMLDVEEDDDHPSNLWCDRTPKNDIDASSLSTGCGGSAGTEGASAATQTPPARIATLVHCDGTMTALEIAELRQNESAIDTVIIRMIDSRYQLGGATYQEGRELVSAQTYHEVHSCSPEIHQARAKLACTRPVAPTMGKRAPMEVELAGSSAKTRSSRPTTTMLLPFAESTCPTPTKMASPCSRRLWRSPLLVLQRE
jgi:hypothetical protein